MDTSKLSARRLRRLQAAFSLIEVTMAIGIMAFAFVAVFGMLPVGLNTFHEAVDAAIGAQIAQKVIGEAEATDFDQLIKDGGGNPITGPYMTGLKKVRYFDDQGNELTSSTGAIYHVNTRITPATPLPTSGPGPAPLDNVYLATVTVQVANNPGNQVLAKSTDDAADQSKPLRNLWTSARGSNPSNLGVVPISTYSALVSRNK